MNIQPFLYFLICRFDLRLLVKSTKFKLISKFGNKKIITKNALVSDIAKCEIYDSLSVISSDGVDNINKDTKTQKFLLIKIRWIFYFLYKLLLKFTKIKKEQQYDPMIDGFIVCCKLNKKFVEIAEKYKIDYDWMIYTKYGISKISIIMNKKDYLKMKMYCPSGYNWF